MKGNEGKLEAKGSIYHSHAEKMSHTATGGVEETWVLSPSLF